MDAKELPGLLRAIEVYQGTHVTRLAIKLMALTFVRTSELIGAKWSEFNTEDGRWDIHATLPLVSVVLMADWLHNSMPIFNAFVITEMPCRCLSARPICVVVVPVESPPYLFPELTVLL